MKPKPIFKKLYLLFAFTVLTVVMINSCKKDSSTNTPPAVTDPAIAQAKSWYESAYPAGSKLSTQAVTADMDLSQVIKPDWQHTTAYTRFDDDVIEMPLDAATSKKLGMGLKEQTTGQEYRSDYSRSSFLLIKKLGKYNAYIMTIIADPTYLNGDLSKLDKNKYNKRDTGFTGVVLYSTPKGKFVNAWTYKNGIISGTISPGSTSSGTMDVDKGKTVNALKTNLTAITVCYAWTQTTTYNGVTSAPITLSNDCVTTYSGSIGVGGGIDNNGGAAPGSNGGSGNTAGTPPAPKDDPCAPKGQAVESVSKLNVNGLNVNVVQPLPAPVDPDGGFPPPDGTVPCATVVKSTTVTIPNIDVKDSLSTKYSCARALIAQLTTLNANVAKILYQAFGSANGPSITFHDGAPAYFQANPGEDGYTDNGFNIFINPAVLANSSNEYRLVTFYHEAIHSFLQTEHNNLTPDQFAAKYPMVKVLAKPNFTSVVGKDPYDYWIDPGSGYETKIANAGHITMAEYFIDELKNAILAYNPNFPPDRALAMAKFGIIEDSSTLYLNNAERDVTKGNSVGTKCP